jgi:hypothetical protein
MTVMVVPTHQSHLPAIRRTSGIILGEANQHADAPHPLRLLRAGSERLRTRSYRTAEERKKLASPHSSPNLRISFFN